MIIDVNGGKIMIRPLHDYVLIEKEPKEKKVGSIVLTTEKKQGNVAKVVALGPGNVNDDGFTEPINGLQVGDKVIYREYAGTDYKDEDHEYIVIKAEDILAVIE